MLIWLAARPMANDLCIESVVFRILTRTASTLTALLEIISNNRTVVSEFGVMSRPTSPITRGCVFMTSRFGIVTT